jgi:hypothetical protein
VENDNASLTILGNYHSPDGNEEAVINILSNYLHDLNRVSVENEAWSLYGAALCGLAAKYHSVKC